MTYLTPHLPFTERHALPPPGTHLLITDTLQSSSKFALYHLLIAAVSNKIRIVLVDFRGEGKESHEAVLKKLGKPIPFSSTNFIYISPSSLPSSIPIHSSDTQPRLFDDADKPTLKETYEIIIRHLQGSLVILDGLGELLNMGFEPVEIGRFVRSLLPEIRKHSTRLISTLHADCLPLLPTSQIPQYSKQTEMVERLLRLSGGWWRISHLPSGRSGDVHGEISSHGTDETWCSQIPRNAPLQYRLEANGVKVFPKGTGRGFL